ncbi:fasciclin domain-containing protein [Belliella sp. R4-6]|uniref:Fasciclin domain-containing protein n=1 Tax=Belliella alkalica TaxID=1730871 RepID=A0ABS9V9K2_9BACT|nr:fasciclin domain-containing protein [Belliella alkalica]MCH7413104.1 fasciclin domain-containing protein [Belliella alkalica]
MKNSKLKLLKGIVLLSAVILSIISCNDTNNLPPQNEQLILGTVEDLQNFTLFVQAVNRAGLQEALAQQGPFTVFAPNDEAFRETLQSLGISSIQNIPSDELQALLAYHIIPGRILYNQIPTGEVETFLESINIIFSRNGNNLTINDSIQILSRNIEARNGMIHEIDKVLFPPANSILNVVENNGFSTFLAAVEAVEFEGLLANEGPFTLFVPTNAAFTRYLTEIDIDQETLLDSPELDRIISYHLIDGVLPAASIVAGSVPSLTEAPIFLSVAPNGAIWVNGKARITASNLAADNGLVHVIDQVIQSPTQSISEKITSLNTVENPQFIILVEALEKTGQITDLDRDFEDNVTLFAPTDAAFEELFADLGVTGINAIEVETLRRILQYHLTPSRLFSQDLREGATLPTLISGQTLSVNLAQLQINESGLISNLLNIHGQNGVVHGIDKVLVPED